MFTSINLPYTKFIPENNATTYYIAAIHSAQPWIEEFGLQEVCKGRDIRCVVGWIKPQHRMPIHIDMGDYGPTPWALDFTTDEFKEAKLELYENLDKNNSPTGQLTAPPNNTYGIPIIKPYQAQLINSWSFSDGAVKFNPGKYWHTGYNPNKEKWMAVVSLRSFFIEDWYAIEEKLTSTVTL
jgi:hypothetical protein